jgi:hypothetical protein
MELISLIDRGLEMSFWGPDVSMGEAEGRDRSFFVR